MRAAVDIRPDAHGLRVGIVASRYHDAIVDRLDAGAERAFRESGGSERDLVRIPAPGAFELPVIAATLARRADIHAVVCLGVVLKGETTHDAHIADSVAHALQRVALDSGKPIAFGVLTCQSIEQAQARAGGAKGNKGEEAMRAAILAARALEAGGRS